LPRGERLKLLDFGAVRLRTGVWAAGSPLYLAPEQCGGSGEQRGSGGEQRGSGGEQRGSGGEQRGSGGEQRGSGGEQRGSGGEQRGSGGEQRGSGGEQRGSGGEIDQRADVYALGALLYHMLCGGPPFAAGVCAPYLDQPPAAPHSLNAEIPAVIEAAIMRALARAPEERFPSTRELVSVLQSVPLPVSPPRLRRPALRIGSVAMGAVVAAAIFWSGRAPGVMSLLPRAVRGAAPVIGSVAIAQRNEEPRPPAAAPPARPARPTVVPLPQGQHTDLRVAAKLRSGRRLARADAPSVDRSVVDQDETWGRRH
jgi:serine/threonine protein kinase